MRLRERLSRQVPAASVAVFRIGFGVVGLILVLRFFAHGWIESLYIAPQYHFSYPGFEWVQVWPGIGMYLHFGLMGLAALGTAVGYRTRISAAAFALLLAYVELIDRSLYLNHYYWLVLTGMVLAFLPSASVWSLDSRAGRAGSREVPEWVVWLFRFQVGMVYFFAGLAKLNPDWLLHGQPMATWLPARSDMAVVGPILSLEPTALVLSWAAALFDLTIVGWLLWRRSRPYAYAAVVLFHTMTWLLFPMIGVFPLVMALGATIYFAPDWPRRLRLLFLPRKPSAERGRWADRREARRGNETSFQVAPASWLRTALAAAYIVLMIALPLRHFVIPGDVQTSGEGYLGSWQVMLTEKVGSVRFYVTDPGSGKTWETGAPGYLTERQLMVMPTDPVMVEQTARLISADNGGAAVEPRVWLTVNGRSSVVLSRPGEVRNTQ